MKNLKDFLKDYIEKYNCNSASIRIEVNSKNYYDICNLSNDSVILQKGDEQL